MHLECSGSPGKSRDFACSCGKDYLSYAALFTHIKQKHAGVVNQLLFRLQDQFVGLAPRGKEEDQEKIYKKILIISLQVHLSPFRIWAITKWYF